jgi:hypothetical protein
MYEEHRHFGCWPDAFSWEYFVFPFAISERED